MKNFINFLSAFLVIGITIFLYRNPNQLETDLQASVDNIVCQEIPFVVFRPDGIKVLSDFKFAGISQGGVKIIEKR